jgi:phosphatidylinositol glycan class M
VADEISQSQHWRVSTVALCLDTAQRLISSPYERATFRYTPLLPLILSPSLIHPLLGKLTLSLLSLLVPYFLLEGPNPAGFWTTHALWTLNPFVLNITTRGSPEAIIVLLVVITLYYLRKADEPGTVHRGRYESLAAVAWAASVSWKIYPVIYGVAIWSSLSARHGLFGRSVWRFGLVSLATFVLFNGALWSM